MPAPTVPTPKVMALRLKLISAVMKRLRRPEDLDLATLTFWLAEIDLILAGGRDTADLRT